MKTSRSLSDIYPTMTEKRYGYIQEMSPQINDTKLLTVFSESVVEQSLGDHVTLEHFVM